MRPIQRFKVLIERNKKWKREHKNGLENKQKTVFIHPFIVFIHFVCAYVCFYVHFHMANPTLTFNRMLNPVIAYAPFTFPSHFRENAFPSRFIVIKLNINILWAFEMLCAHSWSFVLDGFGLCIAIDSCTRFIFSDSLSLFLSHFRDVMEQSAINC